jgi:hypothetical protein
MGRIIPYIMEKKCLKPPTRLGLFGTFRGKPMENPSLAGLISKFPHKNTTTWRYPPYTKSAIFLNFDNCVG